MVKTKNGEEKKSSKLWATNRTFLNLLDDAVIIVNKKGKIKRVNSSAIRNFGKDLLGKKLLDVIDDTSIGLLCDSIISKPSVDETQFQTSDLVPRIYRVRARQIDSNLYALLFLDMTFQRNLESVRRDFVANVSHELRSPLTSLAGFVETLLSQDLPDPEMQKRFLRIMEDEAGRMSRLLDDLLSLSRVELEEHIPPDEKIPIVAQIRAVCANLANKASKRGMTIKMIVRRGLPKSTRILGNYDEVSEVFVNLIENAIKYGNESSKIKVIISLAEPSSIRIDVINRGEGIEKKHIPRLSERFYRVDKARSRQIGGTGLGLAIVKHIVNRHRGEMVISSQPGLSATFSIILPINP